MDGKKKAYQALQEPLLESANQPDDSGGEAEPRQPDDEGGAAAEPAAEASYDSEDDDDILNRVGMYANLDMDRRDLMRDSDVDWIAQDSSHPLKDAAIFLHEGRMNLFMTEHPKTDSQVKLWFFLHRSWFPYFDLFMAMLYMALALVEPPATPYLTNCPIQVIIFIQVLCLSTNITQILLNLTLVDTWKTKQLPKGLWLQLGVAFVLLTDLIIYMAHSEDPDWHVMRALRPAYLLSTQKAAEIRRVVRFLVSVLYEVIDMFVFLIFYIGVWAVMATFLFGPNPQDNFFANLGDSFTQLFVLITTCNYPSVMLPAYTQNQASFLFFFIFIVIGIYFILNLILAIVFRVYTEAERNKFRKRFLRQRAALRFAYRALVQASEHESGCVTWEAFNECLKVYGHFRSQKARRIMFCALNKPSRSGVLSLDEFYEFYNMLAMDWHRSHFSASDGTRMRAATVANTEMVWTLEAVTAVLASAGAGEEQEVRSFFNRLVHSPQAARIADLCSDGIVLMQTIYLTILASQLKSGEQSNEDQINRAILGFLVVFTVEIVLKVAGLGVRGYWMYPWHRFDAFFTVIGWIGIVCDRYTTFHLTAPVVILRAFRLANVLTMSSRSTFTDVMTTAFTIMPRMIRFGGALFCSYYSFAIVGMTFLRDTASNCPADAFSKCGQPYAFQLTSANNTDDVYGFGHYQEMNFNNVWQSYVTLFTLMVVNDWNNTMGGHAVAAGTWSRAFFMCFYLFTVLIVVNVILAYVLEMFQIIVEGQEIKRKMAKGREMQRIDELTHGVSVTRNEPLSTATVIELRMTTDDLRAVGDGSDRDLSILRENTGDDPNGYVVYRGTPQLTQTALYLMLFQDNVERWIEEESPTGGLRGVRGGSIGSNGRSVYADEEEDA